MPVKYRPEIDGLRAVAVLPVIMFHSGMQGFEGGFVGVDIFFVISGFLITTIILNDIDSGHFDLVSFYERRARRILPALFLVTFLCIPTAWILMDSGQIADFSQSLLGVSLFVSNIVFWLESGYFSAAAEEKPLLHTWSLAVEEQFYLFFPLLLLLGWRFGKSSVYWSISVVMIVSFALSEWSWRNYPSANFYLLPTRTWELLAGSLAALSINYSGVRKNNLLSIFGGGLILFAFATYDEGIPFPSRYTLAPVIGVVLLLQFAHPSTLIGRLLSLKPLVGMGLISYSAYLWHQPLFAFGRLNSHGAPPPIQMLALALISIALATASWRYVENIFRDRTIISSKNIFLFSAAGMALLFCIGASLPSMHAIKNSESLVSAFTIEEEKKRRFQSKRQICREKTWANCNSVEADKLNVLIIGDSHSADALTAIITAIKGQENQVSFSTSELGGCNAMPNSRKRLSSRWPNRVECINLNEKERYNVDFLKQYDVLALNFLISEHWGVADLITYLQFLEENHSGQILVFGGSFAFSEELPSYLNKERTLENIREIQVYNPSVDDQQLAAKEFSDVFFFSKYDAFCPDDKCRFISHDGFLMTYDKHHLSVKFAEILGKTYEKQIRGALNLQM